MAICRLCTKNRELRNSHIVPEFLYSKCYNSKRQIMGIDGTGNRGRKLLQKGIREHLLCEGCEQHFNEEFEKPFRKQWIEEAPLPDPWNVNDVHWLKLDYRTFKLFHLSILFRASVSSFPMFSAVSLGAHEETIRSMLWTVDPGPVSQYPILGHAVIHHKTKALIQGISRADRSKFNGHRCYGMMYGGVIWWWSISSHQNYEFESMALRADGSMPFHAVPWNEISVIQSAAEALRHGYS